MSRTYINSERDFEQVIRLYEKGVSKAEIVYLMNSSNTSIDRIIRTYYAAKAHDKDTILKINENTLNHPRVKWACKMFGFSFEEEPQEEPVKEVEPQDNTALAVAKMLELLSKNVAIQERTAELLSEFAQDIKLMMDSLDSIELKLIKSLGGDVNV